MRPISEVMMKRALHHVQQQSDNLVRTLEGTNKYRFLFKKKTSGRERGEEEQRRGKYHHQKKNPKKKNIS